MAVIDPPDYVERVCVAGANGSGKTVFIRELLGAGYPRWVVIDVKHDFRPPAEKYELVHDPHDRRLLVADRVLYRPTSQFKTRQWLEYVFAVLLKRGEHFSRTNPPKPFVVVVDEGLAISRTRAVLNLGNIAVTGRGLGIGLWVLSQRCKWIPVEVKSEAWRWYVFYLGDEDDEREILKFAKGELSLAELRAATHSHRFVELRRGAESGGRVSVRAFGKVRQRPSSGRSE